MELKLGGSGQLGMVCGFLPDCLAVTTEEPWRDFQDAGAGLEGRRGQAERSGDELREGGGGSLQNGRFLGPGC